MAERPLIRVPDGWTYGEESRYVVGRWETVYRVAHDACGAETKELYRPVGDSPTDAGWYSNKCAEGLLFFIEMHTTCSPGSTEKEKD